MIVVDAIKNVRWTGVRFPSSPLGLLIVALRGLWGCSGFDSVPVRVEEIISTTNGKVKPMFDRQLRAVA